MRLKSEIWVKAFIRRLAGKGIPAAVARHGDDDAGAIYVRINRLNGTSSLYGPAPAGFAAAAEDREWVALLGGEPRPDAEIEGYLAREASFDSDLWIVEVEDRSGHHHLDGWLAPKER